MATTTRSPVRTRTPRAPGEDAPPKLMNLRLPPDLYALLTQLARSEDRSIHAQALRIMRQALEPAPSAREDAPAPPDRD